MGASINDQRASKGSKLQSSSFFSWIFVVPSIVSVVD
jgi:hypothetical protein